MSTSAAPWVRCPVAQPPAIASSAIAMHTVTNATRRLPMSGLGFGEEVLEARPFAADLRVAALEVAPQLVIIALEALER